MKISSWTTLVVKPTHMPRTVAVLATVLALSACNNEKLEEFSGPTMGSTYTVKYVSDGGTPAHQDIQTEVLTILKELDAAVSTYRKDTAVAGFNALPAGECQTVSTSITTLFDYAKTLNQLSNQAYDITLLPALSAWGFGPTGRSTEEAPTTQDLDKLRSITGMQHVFYGPKDTPTTKQLCKDRDLSIEFNSIAAGYAVDRIADYLNSSGINSYLIEVTGELLAKGHKPDGSPWRVALEAPISNTRAAQRIVALNGEAASTSGDYRDYYEKNGVRYSHTLDPRTLSPVTHRLASVSVIAKTAMEADGLSTLLMILGPEHGYDFATAHQLVAMFVSSNPNNDAADTDRTFTVRTTPQFDQRFPSTGGTK